MNYCGIAVGPQFQHLCRLEEVRTPEPPVRLRASFYEPGSVEDVVTELTELGDVVVAVGAPQTPPPEGQRMRACDAALLRRGVSPQPVVDAGLALYRSLEPLGLFTAPGGAAPGDETAPVEAEGVVPEGAFRTAPVFEVNVDAVFCALQGRRVPAKRHPLGVLRRIEELQEDHVEDGAAGDLWNRRIDEIEAAAAALAAHRYAVGHACWLGDPAEGVIVLPGARPPAAFSAEGVIPPVERLPLGDPDEERV